MRTFSTPRLHGFKTRHRERGITLMFVVVAIFALLGVAALAIDLVTLYVSKAEAQRVADAAALAGAKALIDHGVTSDPSNTQNNWSDACDQATAQASVVGNQGKIGGSAPATLTVNFGSGGAFGACPASGAPGTGFGVNPQVGVTVRSVDLPLFFAKIWGQRTSTVSASSRAEGFNPSGTNIPVAAKCITPWLIANIDTPHALRIMRTNNGRIRLPGPASGGIIGESLALRTKCAGPACATWTPPSTTSGDLSYYPIDLGTPAASGPSCSAGGFTNYMNNIVACNPTPIACGSTVTIDTTTFPDGPPNTQALNCLTNSTAPGPANSGQDTVNTTTFPPTIAAGAGNPLVGIPPPPGITAGDLVSSSRSVVTIPIYDSGLPTGPTAPASPVTVIGFMQAFVQYVDATGHPQITVLNVSGCQTTASGSPVGTNAASSVPVRLIHP